WPIPAWPPTSERDRSAPASRAGPCRSRRHAPVPRRTIACCSTMPARVSPHAVLVRTWKPAKPEMMRPSGQT
ncbi:MAG: hypothetical protein AVDCRST_MAG08-337, partial [uncultured Acetobacteraceae bacterium]